MKLQQITKGGLELIKPPIGNNIILIPRRTDTRHHEDSKLPLNFEARGGIHQLMMRFRGDHQHLGCPTVSTTERGGTRSENLDDTLLN